MYRMKQDILKDSCKQDSTPFSDLYGNSHFAFPECLLQQAKWHCEIVVGSSATIRRVFSCATVAGAEGGGQDCA